MLELGCLRLADLQGVGNIWEYVEEGASAFLPLGAVQGLDEPNPSLIIGKLMICCHGPYCVKWCCRHLDKTTMTLLIESYRHGILGSTTIAQGLTDSKIEIFVNIC